jgi:hypothetical protein
MVPSYVAATMYVCVVVATVVPSNDRSPPPLVPCQKCAWKCPLLCSRRACPFLLKIANAPMVSGFTHAIIVIPAVGLRIGSSACPSHVLPSRCFALLDGSVGSRDPVVVIPVPASVVSVRPFPDESVRSSSRQYPIGE